MKIIADSNIIFSSLISGKEIYIDIFRTNEIYVPDIALLELDKYEASDSKNTDESNRI